MKQIFDILNNKCKLFWEAAVDFKATIYTYYPEDKEKLFLAFNNGILSKNCMTYTDQEIQEL